jgi:hypothetical protein
MVSVVNLRGAALWASSGTIFADRGAPATQRVNAAARYCAAGRSAGIQTYCRKAPAAQLRINYRHRLRPTGGHSNR